MMSRFDIVIAGMGPAGMSAAIQLAEFGITVAVIDDNNSPGGQVYRQVEPDLTVTDMGFLGFKFERGRKLIAGFNQVREKIQVFENTYIWGVFDDNILAVMKKGVTERLRFDKLLLSEGAMERSIPFPGWTLPGIMTLGGLHRLVVQQRVLPAGCIVLAGCSPLLLPVAASLAKAGAGITALCDTTGPMDHLKLIPGLMRQKGLARETLSYLFPVLKAGIPTMRPYTVVSAEGQDRVKAVTVAKLDENWKPVAGSEKRIEADFVGIGYGFLPQARLARLCGCKHHFDPVQLCWQPETDIFMQTSRPGVYIAGDSAKISGSHTAAVQGRIAAVHMAAELKQLTPAERDKRLAPLFKQQERIGTWAKRLNQIFAPRKGLYTIMDKETVVCRCERITAGEIRAGMEDFGYQNINEIKRTRAGMGLCQAKTCESVIAQLMSQSGIPMDKVGYLGLRPPLSPIPISHFGSVTPEEDDDGNDESKEAK